MKILLDTHTFFWSFDDDSRLSSKALEQMTDISNELLVSIASVWELSIKSNIGKLKLPLSIEPLIQRQLELNRLVLLPISLESLGEYERLPLHRRDPFDRLIVAQALTENLPIISSDTQLDAYLVKRIW
jgi:PIN domain nuclease of toxin-antitoxin system